MREQLTEQALIYSAFTYRELNDADLTAYTKFLASDLGQKIYNAVSENNREMSRKLMRKFGHDLMVRMGSRDL